MTVLIFLRRHDHFTFLQFASRFQLSSGGMTGLTFSSRHHRFSFLRRHDGCNFFPVSIAVLASPAGITVLTFSGGMAVLIFSSWNDRFNFRRKLGMIILECASV